MGDLPKSDEARTTRAQNAHYNSPTANIPPLATHNKYKIPHYKPPTSFLVLYYISKNSALISQNFLSVVAKPKQPSFIK